MGGFGLWLRPRTMAMSRWGSTGSPGTPTPICWPQWRAAPMRRRSSSLCACCSMAGQCGRDVLDGRAVIAVLRVAGAVKDVWVTDDPASESGYLSQGESIELRLWDGTTWSGT